MFFAISGLLITLTSLRRFGGLAHVRPALFYRTRFARIGPPLLLVLAVLSVLHWASLHSPAFLAWHVQQRVGLPRALFAALTFHLNWLEVQTGYLPANWDVLWSVKCRGGEPLAAGRETTKRRSCSQDSAGLSQPSLPEMEVTVPRVTSRYRKRPDPYTVT